MDFHSLARRELQDLCKKNKIPANMTNVAMADALNALEIVEGIEEYLKPIESETAQSSIESPMKSEATSPCGLPAVGRSTCRRNVVKEEPKTLPSRTATRRSTRKTVAGDDGGKGVAIETPALAATTRRRAQVSTVRRKVETQFEEEETAKDKKTVPTPAPLGTTSRRKVKEEESTVKRVYSTRRSVRLAGKSVESLKANEGEKLETFKQELFTDDNLDMNLKQGSDASDKVLDINVVGTDTMSEDNSEKTDNLDIVFEEEKKENSELEERLDESKIIAGENIENQLDLDSSNEIQESDGSHGMGISEAENALDNGVESKDMEADNTVDDVIGNKDDEIPCDAKSPMETEKETEYAEDMDSEVFPDIVVDENSCDVDVKKETQKEPQDDDMVKDESGLATEKESLRKVLGDDLEADIEFIDHSTFPEQIDNEEEPDSIEILECEQRKQDADQVSIATEESLGEVSSDETEAHFDFIDQSTFSKQIEEKYDSVEILESEQSKQERVSLSLSTPIPTADPTMETQSYRRNGELTEKNSLSFAGSDPEPVVVQSTGFTPMKTPIKRTPSKTPKTIKKMPNISDDKENLASGSKILIFMEKVQTPSKTPTTNRKMTDVSDNKENLDSGKGTTKEKVQTPSKTPTTNRKMTDVSDNKENLDSSCKGTTKEKAVKKARGTTTKQNLDQFSLRKLTKMFKEKLQITNHSSQNENDPKTAKATSRPALHALPENQLVEEAQN